MYYHASSVQGIKELEPRVSNHNVPLIYFSQKRENVLVYLCNAVEKYCKETGFEHSGKWSKWGPYGFNEDGTLRFEEYYPNALEDTYKGVSGYIYSVENIKNSGFDLQIPSGATSSEPVAVEHCECVPDALEAILSAEKEGLITILRYENLSEAKLKWIKRTIKAEYENAANQPDYRHFLEGKFHIAG